MWKKGYEYGTRQDFQHTSNPDQNGAQYVLRISSEGEKILEIDWVNLSKGLGSARSYLLHLADLVLESRPHKITWEVYKDDLVHHEKLSSLYGSLGNSEQWPGIEFARVEDPIETFYRIDNPKGFAELVKSKFGRK